MGWSQALRRFGLLLPAFAIISAPTAALASEEHLEFKLVTVATDVKVAQAPNVDGRVLLAGKYFGVAYFSDGRVAVKDFIGAGDLLNGLGALRGYSTYTFEDGSSLTLSYTAEAKETGIHGDYTVVSGTGPYDKSTGAGTFDSVTKFKDGATLFNVKLDVKTP
jgi:hypothetical protein